MKPIQTLEELQAAVMECADLELALVNAETSCKKRVERIKQLHHEETAEHAARRDGLREAVLEFVRQNRGVLMNGKKSVGVLGHVIRVATSSFAACDDEAAAVARLEDESKHGANKAQREAAQACLRVALSLNKEFIHAHFDKHAAWFESLGLRLETAEKWALKFNFTPEGKGAK